MIRLKFVNGANHARSSFPYFRIWDLKKEGAEWHSLLFKTVFVWERTHTCVYTVVLS